MEEVGQWKGYDQNVLNEIKFFKKSLLKFAQKEHSTVKGIPKSYF